MLCLGVPQIRKQTFRCMFDSWVWGCYDYGHFLCSVCCVLVCPVLFSLSPDMHKWVCRDAEMIGGRGSSPGLWLAAAGNQPLQKEPRWRPSVGSRHFPVLFLSQPATLSFCLVGYYITVDSLTCVIVRVDCQFCLRCFLLFYLDREVRFVVCFLRAIFLLSR